MAIHKLVFDDLYDDFSFLVIGIHCTIEDYRLVYLLNDQLKTSLQRKPEDLDFTNEVSYSLFEWIDEKQFVTWNLVSNVSKKERVKTEQGNSLFPDQGNILETNHLIPEHKKVNYFLKINDDSGLINEKRILNNIQNIPQIVTAYTINLNELKSKANLIFD